MSLLTSRRLLLRNLLRNKPVASQSPRPKIQQFSSTVKLFKDDSIDSQKHERVEPFYKRNNIENIQNETEIYTHVSQVPTPLQYKRQIASNDTSAYWWITDKAKVFKGEDVKKMNSLCDKIVQETGCEVALVTLPSLKLENHHSVRNFGEDLFNTWGIGDPKKNDGILILVTMQPRRIEILTGDGIRSILSDQYLGEVLAGMVPFLKQNQFSNGFQMGLTRICTKLQTGGKNDGYTGGGGSGEGGSRGEEGTKSAKSDNLSSTKFWAGTAVLGGAAYYIMTDKPECPYCHSKDMQLILRCDETNCTSNPECKKIVTNKGAIKEHQLGVSYTDISKCNNCNKTSTRLREGTRAYAYSKCKCGYRTEMVEKEEIISHATTTTSGVKRTWHNCANCNAKRQEDRMIPIIAQQTVSATSSTSSSSSGSSYSSGSSGGSYSSGSSSGYSGGRTSGGGSGASF